MDKQSLVLKHLFLFFVMGMIYFTLEGFWNGKANIIMLPVGGICGLLTGLLNEFPKFFNLKMWQQTLLGTFIVTLIEFISGVILNIYLGLNLWNYSSMWGNLYGQITPQYMFLWSVILPFGIFVDDFLRYKFYNEDSYYPIYENYIKLITLK